jgi:hypothetical protein
MPPKPAESPLDHVAVATPCRADWNLMLGDETIRFCTLCRRNVYNLSGMSREKAEQVLLEHRGSLCIRLYRRSDGTVLTADCPVGLADRARQAWGWVTAALVAVTAFVLGLAAFALRDECGKGVHFPDLRLLLPGPETGKFVPRDGGPRPPVLPAAPPAPLPPVPDGRLS